jgi:hypothetical protein
MDASMNESPLDSYPEKDNIIDSDLNNASDEEVEYSVEGDLLMVKCVLSLQVKNNDLKHHRKNIFHLRCHISNKYKYWPLMPLLSSYKYGREHPDPRCESLINYMGVKKF